MYSLFCAFFPFTNFRIVSVSVPRLYCHRRFLLPLRSAQRAHSWQTAIISPLIRNKRLLHPRPAVNSCSCYFSKNLSITHVPYVTYTHKSCKFPISSPEIGGVNFGLNCVSSSHRSPHTRSVRGICGRGSLSILPIDGRMRERERPTTAAAAAATSVSFLGPRAQKDDT